MDEREDILDALERHTEELEACLNEDLTRIWPKHVKRSARSFRELANWLESFAGELEQ